MDDATYTAESRYLRTLADLLGLRDWHITLSRASAEEGSRAVVHILHTKDEAEVVLGQAWFSFTPDQRRQTMTHELLHLHTGRLCRVVTRITGLDEQHLRYVQQAHDEEEEIVVQRLARVIAPFLPLPGDA